jgi:hypothetical protein
MEKKLGAMNEIVAAIKSRGSVRATADNVRHYNWLQFQWSYRFILCAQGDFDLAVKMLREHPELRTGMAMTANYASSREGSELAMAAR